MENERDLQMVKASELIEIHQKMKKQGFQDLQFMHHIGFNQSIRHYERIVACHDRAITRLQKLYSYWLNKPA